MPTNEELNKRIEKLKNQMEELKRQKKQGCLRFDEGSNRWSFSWCETGEDGKRKLKFKYFGVNTHGAKQAKKMAEAYRLVVFPESN